MFTPIYLPLRGCVHLKGGIHSSKSNFLKANSLAFAFSCDRILDLLLP